MASSAPRDRPAILVVDDDPDVRTILSILLSHNGHEVITAGDGATVLELARVRQVGLVVIDLHMPRLRGDGFCDKYRKHDGDAPIFLLTAARVDSEAVARYGADAYIARPFQIGQVLEAVERLVGPP